MLKIGSRKDFGVLLHTMGYERGAEVGVQLGHFSATIREHWGGELHLVDSWTMIPEFPGLSIAGQMINYTKVVVRFLEDYSVHIHRMPSEQAAAMFQDGFFDWVYLDADHRPASFRKELRLWLPKVREGGLMAGHDYVDNKTCVGEVGVRTAVDQLVAARGYELHVAGDDGWPSWYFLKQ